MKPHERISQAITDANAAGRTALVPFLTAGYPKLDGFLGDLRVLAEHGDVVEIGVPFSDPMADGLTIQRSSHSAIEQGVSLRWILQSLHSDRQDISAPLILMSYLNPLLAYGLEDLARDAYAAGVCGFIVPDLPYEESSEFRSVMQASGLALIQLVTPATPPERLAMLAKASQGFVYAVTVRGITGGGAGLPADTADYLTKVRQLAAPTPVCAGFGIRTADQVRAVGEMADGAIVGSALIELQEQGGDLGEFLRALVGE